MTHNKFFIKGKYYPDSKICMYPWISNFGPKEQAKYIFDQFIVAESKTSIESINFSNYFIFACKLRSFVSLEVD